MVDVARDLAERGFYVFPLKERGKAPLTPNGFKDATRDEREILHMWERNPGANVGIDLKRSGLYVLDVDPKNGADPHEVADALGINVAESTVVWTGEAPEPSKGLPDSLSGTRGAHFYFTGHERTQKTPIEGVEFRGDGSYVVAPGSIHESGVEYVGDLSSLNGAEAPQGVRRLLDAARVQLNATAKRVEGPILTGSRNDTLTSFAGSMRRRGMSEAGMLAALRIENQRCVPPLDEHELVTIAHSIGRKDPAPQFTQPAAAPAPAGSPEAIAPMGGAHPYFYDMAQVLARAEEAPPWRVEPIAADAAVTTIAAMRAERKTTLTLALCAAVFRGDELAGMRTKQGKALYVDAENGWRHMGRLMRQMGIGAEAVTVADGMRLRLPQHVAVLRAMIEAAGANVCILDSLRRLAPGAREDKSDDMAPIYAGLSSVAQATNCAVVVLHHRSTKEFAADTRGSSAIEDQSDMIFVLERVRSDDEGRWRKRLRCTKSRIDTEPPPRWLRFDQVAGFLTVSQAEPADSVGPTETPTEKTDALMDKIRALAEIVRKDGGWSPARIAERLSVDRQSYPLREALRRLVRTDEWVAEGTTRARTYRPSVSVGLSDSLGGDRQNTETAERLFDESDGASDFYLPPDWKPYKPEDGASDEDDDEEDWRNR